MTDTNENQFERRLMLTPEQADVVDDLLRDGRDWDDYREVGDGEGRRVARLLQLLDHYEVDHEAGARSDLVSVTMARIGEVAGSATGVDDSLCPAGLRIRGYEVNELSGARLSISMIHWREIASIAAVILLLVSITVPMLDNARAQAVRQKCCANMMGTAVGFTGYSEDHEGALPAVMDSAVDVNWLISRANSANLFALAKAGYVSLETLSCPGNVNAEVSDQLLAGMNWPDRSGSSFSYQNQLTSDRIGWRNPGRTIAILSDRNPIVDYAAGHLGDGEDGGVSAEMISPSHGGELQNVLLTDGSVMQLGRPVFGGDNIWLPSDFEVESGKERVRLSGVERPVDRFDSMLIQ